MLKVQNICTSCEFAKQENIHYHLIYLKCSMSSSKCKYFQIKTPNFKCDKNTHPVREVRVPNKMLTLTE